MVDPNFRPYMPYSELLKNIANSKPYMPYSELIKDIASSKPYTPYSEVIKEITSSNPHLSKSIAGALGIGGLTSMPSGFKALIASFQVSIEASSNLSNTSKYFEVFEIAKGFSAISANLKALSVANNVFLQEQASLAKSFSGFTGNQAIAKLLQSNVPLYQVKIDSLQDYLKHPIFDIYDLNSEVILNSFEDDDLTDVITQEDNELSETEDSSQLIITIPFKSLIEKVKQETLDHLHWREFEELISELLREEEWNVELLGGTKDGGADIIATKEDEHIGLIKCVWQAKKYAITNKVKLPVIKELADTRNEFSASKAILVTTSFLTKGAKDRVQRDQHILAKKERNEVECWISKFTNN